MNEPVIILCPCCASTVDAYAGDDPQDFDCVQCGQEWSMLVDSDRFSIYSLS